MAGNFRVRVNTGKFQKLKSRLPVTRNPNHSEESLAAGKARDPTNFDFSGTGYSLVLNLGTRACAFPAPLPTFASECRAAKFYEKGA